MNEIQGENLLACRLKTISKWSAIAVIIGGCLVIAGWIFNIQIFNNALPDLASMKFSTALAFALVGIALLRLRSQPRLAQFIAAFIILLGLLTLSEYILGWNSGIDKWLVNDAASAQNPYPGRMSFLSAVNFVLVGTAIILLIRTHRYWLAQTLMLFSSFFSLIVIIGYLYLIEALYRVGSTSSTALLSAIFFTLLGITVLAAEPDQGFTRIISASSAGGYTARRMLPVALILPIVGGVLRWQGQQKGWFSVESGLALGTVSNIFVASILISWIAWRLHVIDEERAQAAAELQMANDELDNRVRARTGELLEANQALKKEIRERERTYALYHTLIEQLPDSAVILFDREMRYVIADGPILSKTGYSQEQMLGKTIFEVLPPESQKALLPLYERVLRGETFQFERETAGISYDSRFVPVYDKDGEISNGLILVHDVTEYKIFEGALQAAMKREQEFQNYLKTLHEVTIELTSINALDEFYKKAVDFGLHRFGFERAGLLLLNPETMEAMGTYGTDTNGNLESESHLRLRPSDLTGILMRSLEREELFAADEDAELFSQFEPIGRGANAAAVLWHGTEKLGWLTVDNGVRHEPLDETKLTILSLYAVTLGSLLAQKRTQAAVESSERHLRLLAENSPDVIYILDLRRLEIIYHNREEFAGYSFAELENRESRIRTLHPDDRARVLAHWNTWITGEGLENLSVIEYQMQDKAGRWQWVESRETIFDSTPEGKPTQILVTLTLITERKLAERQAVELAKEREQVKILSDFIRDTSHDFRTPLTIISSNLYLLSRVNEMEKRKGLLENADAQVSRMTRLLDRLQLMVRLDSQAAIMPRQVNLNQVVADFCTRVEAASKKKDIMLTCSVSESILIIQAERETLEMALIELGNNAIWYTPPQGTVTIRTRQEGDWAIIEVADTGPGIAEEEQQRIFQRLYRVDDSRSSQTGGTGLGLAIAKKIVELHNGRIEVESVVGEGSLFRICLPFSS